jgi:hypothetical protein
VAHLVAITGSNPRASRGAGAGRRRRPAQLRRTISPAADPSALPSAPRRMFETFSFLPPLSDREIAKQVDYMINNRQ